MHRVLGQLILGGRARLVPSCIDEHDSAVLGRGGDLDHFGQRLPRQVDASTQAVDGAAVEDNLNGPVGWFNAEG